MALDKLTKLTSNSGISTVIDYTMSDLVVDSINIAGGGTTLGKDFETRNLKVTGLSTFVGNVQMDGNLTVNGTTTTLDTNLIGVDRVEVVANNNNYAGIAVTQSGTGDIISAYDGSTQVFAVNDGNKVGIADSIYHIGDDNTAFGFPAADTFKIDTAGAERLRITPTGQLLLGINNAVDAEVDLQIHSATSGNGPILNMTNNTGDCRIFFGQDNSSGSANAQGQIRYNVASNHLTAYTAGDERLRIDSSGRTLVGHTASLDQNAQIQSFTTGTDTFAGFKYGNNAAPNIIRLGKSRNASEGGNTIVADGDEIGRLLFSGNDGSQYRDAAYISAFVDGSPSTGTDMPGRLSFFTSPDGSLPSLERLRIDRNGNVGVGTITPNSYSNYTTFTINGTTGGQIDIESNSTKYGDIYTQSNALHVRNKQSSGSGVLVFHTTNSGTCEERLRIDSAGRLLQGLTTARANFGNNTSGVEVSRQLEGTSYVTSAMSIIRNSNDGNDGGIILGKTRAGSVGGSTVVQADDFLGEIMWVGADGTSLLEGARIDAVVESGVGNDDMPTALRFLTNGGSTSPDERLRIDSSGRVIIGDTSTGNAFSGGDSLVIGNTTSGTRSGITLVSHSGQDGGLYFSRGGSSNSDYVKGQIVYNHSSDYFAFYTGATGIRLKIDSLGGHNIYNANTYNAANLAECDSDHVALNIRKTRGGQTKGIAIGAVGGSSGTGIQAYDSSDDSANELALNPYGGALLVGLTAPTYSSGDMQHEIKKNNSRTYTAPLMAAHSHLLLNNSDTTAGVFCGIGMRAGTGDGAIGFHYRGATNQSDFVIATDSGGNGVEGFRIKSQTRTCSIGENIDPLNALHILDKTNSSWDAALTEKRAVLRLETHYTQQGARAAGDYGSGIVFNHLGGHSSSHNNDSHAWLGLRVHDTPGYERSCLVFATNDQVGSESTHDAGLKERMQINPHGQVAINYSGVMATTSHARLWVESDGISVASDSEYNFGDNQGLLPHLTLAGQNSHVRLDMGTMDVAPYGGYIQARYDNTPDLGSTDSDDGLEPLELQPRGGLLMLNMGRSTTMPGNLNPTNEKGGIRMRAGTASSASVSEANTAIKIWPGEERVYSGGLMGDADQGSKYGGIAWLVLDSMSPGKSGWAPYDGNQCWMGMSLHSTPGQELANWQLRMNNSGNQNSVANQIALQASPQGWVTKPHAIVFMAHHNASTRITSTGYQTFGDQIEENGGDHYSNSNGKFTAPIGGYYYFYLKVNAVNRIDMQIRINGSTDHTHREIGQFNTSNGVGGWFSHNITRIFRMEKDEYAQVYISSLNQQTDPGEWCTFGGFLIG